MTTSPDFAALGLAPELLRALEHLGYEQPSPIQAECIPALLAGRNLLGTAQTGTGKTAAFALPLLQRLDPQRQTPQVLVLTPTRELAIQVAEAFRSYAKYLPHLTILPIYGGQDMLSQLRALKRGVQVVVGTPGRVLDHLRRQSLDLSQLEALVLDEADEMLRMGFIDDVETVLASTPDSCTRALFSATMPAPIRKVAESYLTDAQQIRIANKTTTVERIEQRYLSLRANQKLEALTRVLEVEPFDAMIIFVRTKSTTVELAEKLEARGYAAAALNGDLSQALRERTVDRLKNGLTDIVVATDVAARGLDVERITHVVNYDIPYDTEAYVHRIGRTGRAGRSGTAILFITPREQRFLKSIERATRSTPQPMALPSGADISAQRVRQFQEAIAEIMGNEDLEPFRALLSGMAEEKQIDLLDIASALAWRAQSERPLFDQLPPLEAPADHSRHDRSDRRSSRHERDERPRHAREKRERRDRPSDSDLNLVTYRIDVGHNDDATPRDIVGAIANEAGIDSKYIGRIVIHDDYSTVDLPDGMPKDVMQHLQGAYIRRKPMAIRLLGAGASASDPPFTRKPRKRFGEDRHDSNTRPRKRFGDDRDHGNAPPRKRSVSDKHSASEDGRAKPRAQKPGPSRFAKNKDKSKSRSSDRFSDKGGFGGKGKGPKDDR